MPSIFQFSTKNRVRVGTPGTPVTHRVRAIISLGSNGYLVFENSKRQRTTDHSGSSVFPARTPPPAKETCKPRALQYSTSKFKLLSTTPPPINIQLST